MIKMDDKYTMITRTSRDMVVVLDYFKLVYSVYTVVIYAEVIVVEVRSRNDAHDVSQISRGVTGRE